MIAFQTSTIVTKVDPTVDSVEADFQPTSEADLENHKMYQDPKVYAGAPVSLQLVGKRYEDEKASTSEA